MWRHGFSCWNLVEGHCSCHCHQEEHSFEEPEPQQRANMLMLMGFILQFVLSVVMKIFLTNNRYPQFLAILGSFLSIILKFKWFHYTDKIFYVRVCFSMTWGLLNWNICILYECSFYCPNLYISKIRQNIAYLRTLGDMILT